MLQAFNDYFAERSSKGVVLAKAVSEVRFEGGIVQVTFDPAKAGSRGTSSFDYTNPFPNLASFVASPIAFNDEVGNRISRPCSRSPRWLQTEHLSGPSPTTRSSRSTSSTAEVTSVDRARGGCTNLQRSSPSSSQSGSSRTRK